MGELNYGAYSEGPMGSIAGDGLQQVFDDEVVFTKYVRVVLPLDGFVFWVRPSLLSDATLTSAGATNAPETLTFRGALHLGTSIEQNIDSSPSRNQVTFTTNQQVRAFNEIGEAELYIAEYDGVRFSFSTAGTFQPEVKLYHYIGVAVYSVMGSLIVDTLDDFDITSPVVSNSLPLWLAMNGYEPKPWEEYSPPIVLYPSFLVPINLRPPYGVVHIGEQDTVGLAAMPAFDKTGTMTQLVQDRVQITLYGLNNNQALDFIAFLYQYATNTGDFGIQNMPVVRDAKQPQEELLAIAQKKTIDVLVDYYQARVKTAARMLIQSAVPSIVVI